jgi:hypothetical protein
MKELVVLKVFVINNYVERVT